MKKSIRLNISGAGKSASYLREFPADLLPFIIDDIIRENLLKDLPRILETYIRTDDIPALVETFQRKFHAKNLHLVLLPDGHDFQI